VPSRDKPARDRPPGQRRNQLLRMAGGGVTNTASSPTPNTSAEYASPTRETPQAMAAA